MLPIRGILNLTVPSGQLVNEKIATRLIDTATVLRSPGDPPDLPRLMHGREEAPATTMCPETARVHGGAVRWTGVRATEDR